MTIDIFDGLSHHFGVVFESGYSNIARLAEKRTNLSGLVVVVNAELFPIGVLLATDGTGTVLGSEHGFVLVGGDSIIPKELALANPHILNVFILSVPGCPVLLPPLALIVSVSFRVLASPRNSRLLLTRLAPMRKSIFGCFGSHLD